VLILVILLQSGRGGGLSESFGSSSTSTIFGTSASTFLQRATSAAAILFLITSLSLAILSSRGSKSLMELEKIKEMLPPAVKETMPGEVPAGEMPAEGAPATGAREIEIPAETGEEIPAKEETPIGQEIPVAE